MPENEESLNQTRLFERNPILNLGGNCHGLCCNFTLYCMKHWNENTEDILHGWNKKLKKNIYAEHPSDRFAERTHQFQFMQDAYKKHRQGIKIEEDASFVESLFGVRNGESESPGSNMIGLDFPSAGGGHIIEIVKRRDGYLIYDPNDDELRFAEIHEKADRIINSRARGQYQFFTDFHIIAMDEYLRSIDMIGTMGKPKRKDEKFRAKLAPNEMIKLHNAIATNYNDEEFRALLSPFTPEQLNSAYRDGLGIIRYAIMKENKDAIKTLLEKGVDVGLNDIEFARNESHYESIDTLLNKRPDLASLTDKQNRNLAYQAAMRQDQEMLEILLKQNPPLDSSIWTTKDNKQETPIDYLIRQDNTEIIDILYEKYPNLTDFVEVKKRITIDKLRKAVDKSNNEKLATLIKQTSPLDSSIWTSRDYAGKTIAHVLLRQSNMKGLEMVLGESPDLARDVAHEIADELNREATEILLRTNPDLANFPDAEGVTVAYKIAAGAMLSKRYETIKMLIPSLDESTWSYKPNDRYTDPLVFGFILKADFVDRAEMLEVLLKRHPNLVNVQSRRGRTLLKSAVDNHSKLTDNLLTIKTLINHGAKIDKNDNGTLDYKMDFFEKALQMENSFIQNSPKAELYTEILEFLQEKKMEKQNSELVEEAKDIGRNIAAQMTTNGKTTDDPHPPGEKNKTSKYPGIT